MMQQTRENSHTVVAVTNAAKPDCSASPVFTAKWCLLKQMALP